MVNYISGLVFIFLGTIGIVVVSVIGQISDALAFVVGLLWFLGAIVVASSIRLAAEWERGVIFRAGRFRSVKGPGIFTMLPLIDHLQKVDTRVQALNISKQSVITKDNVPAAIDGVLFFKVASPADALIKVQNFQFAIAQYAKTSLRDVVGQMTLDQLLSEREHIENAIQTSVERDTRAWGMEITGIRIEDISLPDELMKMMARQASAEREKRATITKAQGDKEAALDLAAAARTMAESPGAMQLRTLQTIDGLGPTASNTVVIAVPVEIMAAINAIRDAFRKG